MLKKIKSMLQRLFPMSCKYCGHNAVVVCKTYDNQKIYMCSNCLRTFKFRYKECFQSIVPYGEYEE